MSVRTLIDVTILLRGRDLSGDHNQIQLDAERSLEVATVFKNESRRRRPGLFDVSMAGQGFWQAGDEGIDPLLFSALSTGREILTLLPDGSTAGRVGYFTQVLAAQYQPGGTVGEMLPFDISAEGDERLIRGKILGNVSLEESGSNLVGHELGAVAEGSGLYAALQVLHAADDPQAEIEIESSDDDTFASPTTRIAFAPANAVGAQFVRVPGPITDTWFRVTWTQEADSEISFVVVAGII